MAVTVRKTGVVWVNALLKAFYPLPIRNDDYKYTGFQWLGYKFFYICVRMSLDSGPKNIYSVCRYRCLGAYAVYAKDGTQL